MCGINGVFAYQASAPPVDREEVVRVRDSMAIRGPDGAGLWISDDERVGLGEFVFELLSLEPRFDFDIELGPGLEDCEAFLGEGISDENDVLLGCHACLSPVGPHTINGFFGGG